MIICTCLLVHLNFVSCVPGRAIHQVWFKARDTVATFHRRRRRQWRKSKTLHVLNERIDNFSSSSCYNISETFWHLQFTAFQTRIHIFPFIIHAQVLLCNSHFRATDTRTNFRCRQFSFIWNNEWFFTKLYFSMLLHFGILWLKFNDRLNRLLRIYFVYLLLVFDLGNLLHYFRN